MSTRPTAWELRFTWEVQPGIGHPKHSYENRFTTRDAAVDMALRLWPRKHQGMSMVEAHVRALPDGEWEFLLPLPATCDVPPRTSHISSKGEPS